MLLDHFHPPLSERRYPAAFHHTWAVQIATQLNEQLPEGWYAEPHVHVGIEVDVATYEEADAAKPEVLEAKELWSPPEPVLTLDFPLAEEEFAVHVMAESAGPGLVGAIELVSRANKDRPETREAFVSKCETYLRSGLGLVIVDIVTDRRADLHSQLIQRVEPTAETDESPLYAAAYHPKGKNSTAMLEIWHEPLSVGEPLPTMPLYLKDGPMVPIELSVTYQDALKAVRIEPDQGLERGN